MRHRALRRPQRGFTLIEAILSIVLIGIVGGIVAVFIQAPIQGYADSVARADISDQADLALRRIARDVRLALPNSIRVNADGNAVEFLMTKAGGRYLSAEDQLTGVPALDFVDAANRQFMVVGPTSTLRRQIAGSDYVVVNNLGADPASAWVDESSKGNFIQANRNIAQVESVDAGDGKPESPFLITLKDNPFAVQTPSMPSPDQRFQLVEGAVSYVCARDANGVLALTRQSGYLLTAQQNVPPLHVPNIALVASNLSECRQVFTFVNSGARLGSMLVMALDLRARNAGDQGIRLVHQVHVDNTP
jgi:MSHA biogenesis protein MshO